MSHSRLRLVLVLIPALALGSQVPLLHAQQRQAQTITLREAVQVALEKNPQRKAALADSRIASAGVSQARSNLLPHVAFSETVTRGTDPVYVFGSKLRQQRFGAADFSLNVLNTPAPFNNLSTRFGGSWVLFDSLSSWRGLSRAGLEKEAAAQELSRTEQEIVFRAIGSYYALLLATRKVTTAEASLQTAQAIEQEARNRFDTGFSVESDSLSARVRMASRQQELVGASNNLALARSQLATVMGVSPDQDYEPADALAERTLPAISLEAAEQQAVDRRPDVKQIASQQAAQRESVAIAKSSFGPRVNAFADWEADNPSLFAGGGGNNWLAGIEIQMDIFEGGAKRAELSRQQAIETRVAAVKESAVAAARLEVRQAYYELDSAQEQIGLARTSIEQSQESLRIDRDRYDAGLSTISDLFAAEEAERRSQSDYWEAVYRYYTSYARLELASGTLSVQSQVVTP